ncbi:MAG: glycosyltransferase [Saprospiraceae bacterium]
MNKKIENKGISVIICCYNSIARIKPTLQHIAMQDVPNNISWEVILVDNNSNDGTADFARQLWMNFEKEVFLHIVTEKKAGLNYAREKGIVTSAYEYIIFCDDDNWLNFSYVSTVYELMSNNDRIGVLGGIGTAVSDTTLPKWFEDLQSFYAVGKQHHTEGNIGYKAVYGAGMVLRKSYFLYAKNKGFKALLSGRKENQLSSGEDYELCLVMILLGYEIWYNERLSFKHFISKARLNWDYLSKLNDANGQVMFVSIAYYHHLKQYPINLGFYLLFGLKFSLSFLVNLIFPPFSYLKKQRNQIKQTYLLKYFKNWRLYKDMRNEINNWIFQ